MADIKSHASLTTGLVSYWDLEEASGTRYDLHGTNHLTDNNTVLNAVGKIGNCADFESTNSEYLSITDASQSGLDITTAGSWSYWIYFESDTDAVVINKFSTGQQSYWIQHQAGTSNKFVVSNETEVIVNYAFSTATWYHIVWTYNAGTAEMFVNGVSQGSGSSGSSLSNTTAPFEIGRVNKYASNYFDGLLEEVGIWSKVLSGTEITDLYNSGNGLPYYDPTDIKNDATLSTSLVSYWKLDETSGTRNDSHSTNHLTENGTGGVGYGTGKNGNSADFERGDSDYLSIADASQTGLDITGSISISLWFKPEETVEVDKAYGLVAKKTSDQNNGYNLAYRNYPSGNQNIVFDIRDTGAGNYYQRISTDVELTSGTWYHIVATCNPATPTVSLYVNGIDVTSTAYTAGTVNSIGDNSDPFYIGHNRAVDYFVDGLIDEVAVHSKALSVAEVRALYGYGTPPVYEATSSSSIKTINGLAIASVKTVSGLAIASVKTVNGLA